VAGDAKGRGSRRRRPDRLDGFVAFASVPVACPPKREGLGTPARVPAEGGEAARHKADPARPGGMARAMLKVRGEATESHDPPTDRTTDRSPRGRARVRSPLARPHHFPDARGAGHQGP